MFRTILFEWLQGAHFYRDLHEAVIEHLPSGAGKNWIDLGCGPGLFTRLAASRGYDALGIDLDPAMVRSAERIARRKQSKAVFEVGDLSYLSGQMADVISAASLLAVLPDRTEALRTMWESVRSGGSLIILEPTRLMAVENAGRVMHTGIPRKRIRALEMWAHAREGHTVPEDILESVPGLKTRLEFLDGMVVAWIFNRNDE
jgi:trans-aconitate methyltransferase